MGFFDRWFKKNLSAIADKMAEFTQPEEFKFYYLYGFAYHYPNYFSNDKESVENLFRLVVGNKGGIAIGYACHPYRIFDKIGVNVWNEAFYQIFGEINSEADFEHIKKNGNIHFIQIPESSRTEDRWRNDAPNFEKIIFKKYHPIIIPFLVPKDCELHFDTEIKLQMASKGNAEELIERVNDALKFLIPEPFFILGLDEFDPKNPLAIVNTFEQCIPLLDGTAWDKN